MITLPWTVCYLGLTFALLVGLIVGSCFRVSGDQP